MGKEKKVNLSQTQSNVPSTKAYTESPTEKATTATTSERTQTSEIAAAIQPLTTIAKLPVAIEPQRPHCPIYCHTRKIEERFETQFKQLYGEELFDTILQTFLAFDASLNKMNREIEWDEVSNFPDQVYQLIKQLPLFRTMCEIDQQLKYTNKCEAGLKPFLHFAAQTHKDGGLILLIHITREVPPNAQSRNLCYFDSPAQFLYCVKDATYSTEEFVATMGESHSIQHKTE